MEENSKGKVKRNTNGKKVETLAYVVCARTKHAKYVKDQAATGG